MTCLAQESLEHRNEDSTSTVALSLDVPVRLHPYTELVIVLTSLFFTANASTKIHTTPSY